LKTATGAGRFSANDQAKKASEYLPLIVAYRSGAAVRLSDLAEVVDSVQDFAQTQGWRTVNRLSF